MARVRSIDRRARGAFSFPRFAGTHADGTSLALLSAPKGLRAQTENDSDTARISRRQEARAARDAGAGRRLVAGDRRARHAALRRDRWRPSAQRAIRPRPGHRAAARRPGRSGAGAFGSRSVPARAGPLRRAGFQALSRLTAAPLQRSLRISPKTSLAVSIASRISGTPT